jgi:hypothetical protein
MFGSDGSIPLNELLLLLINAWLPAQRNGAHGAKNWADGPLRPCRSAISVGHFDRGRQMVGRLTGGSSINVQTHQATR